jgi:TonB family protein
VPSYSLQLLADAEPDIAAPDGAPREGAVTLRVTVSRTGAVSEAVATVGDPALGKAAADAVMMGWRYRPLLVNGEAQEFQSAVLVNFHEGVGKRAAAVIGGVAGMLGTAAPPVVKMAAPAGSVRVASGVIAGLMEHAVAPVYPPIAKAAHVQGVVVLHAIISKTGDIEDLQLISGPPMLVAAAEDAVRQWTYRPYLLNGEPVKVETTINVNFTFGEPKPAGAPILMNGAPPGTAPPDATPDPQ